MRRAVAIVGSSLALLACGGGKGSGAAADATSGTGAATTTAAEADPHRQAYVDGFAATFDAEGTRTDADQRACAGAVFVDVIGLDELVAHDVPTDADEFSPADFGIDVGDDQVDALFGGIEDCGIDLLAETIATAAAVAGDPGTAEGCFEDELTLDDVEGFFAAGLTVPSEDIEDDPRAAGLIEAYFTCGL